MDNPDKAGIEIGFVNRIKKKNIPGYVARKYLIIYAILFLGSLILGLLFCRTGEIVTVPGISARITSFFSDSFDGCEGAKQYFSVILAASAVDIRYILLIFAAGFTYFCKFACGTLVAIRGFSLGFSAEFLIISVRDGLLYLPHPMLSMVIFSVCKVFIGAVLVYLSTKSIIFGDDFRRIRTRKSLIVRSPVIYRYFFLFLTAFGLIIGVNAALCGLISLLA